MRIDRAVRSTAILLSVTLGVLGLLTPSPVGAQTPGSCSDAAEPTPEAFGPTDITATSGNQALSVGLNSDATVTVLKWPSPSFYDQIKYRTTDRSLPLMGARANEGALIGLATRKKGAKKWQFRWLRDWPSTQRFKDDDLDEVITTFKKKNLGMTVVIKDVVADDRDALIRRVQVSRKRGSNVRGARIFTFANFNPVFTKTAQTPFDDWCFEERNDSGAQYLAESDAIVHGRAGTDSSTGAAAAAFLAMGFAKASDGHAVGPDTYQTPGAGTSSYDDAADGKLEGTESATGQVDAVLMRTIKLSQTTSGAVTAIISAAATQVEAIKLLDRMRRRTYRSVSIDKKRWWKRWLKSAPLPKRAPQAIVDLAKRSLISMRQVIDRDVAEHQAESQAVTPGGLIVASIATQSPYGLDWIRHGAYMNRALAVAGHSDQVEAHNMRYAVLQHRTGDGTRGGQSIQAGNWATNHYADGVVGSTSATEVDATGLGMWTLWDHYERTGDTGYLLSAQIYEAIQRSAQYLSDVCVDPATGLQCVGNEDGGANPTRTIRGAMMVWLGLDSAAKAARVRHQVTGSSVALDNAEKWEARRDQLRAAINTTFFDPECNCYTSDFRRGGALIWPSGVLIPGTALATDQAKVTWRQVAPTFAGDTTVGGREVEALMGNALAWRGRTQKIKDLKSGLRWIAKVPTTNETGLLGASWMRYPDAESRVVTMVSQPFVPQMALFYLTALELYGESDYSFK